MDGAIGSPVTRSARGKAVGADATVAACRDSDVAMRHTATHLPVLYGMEHARGVVCLPSAAVC